MTSEDICPACLIHEAAHSHHCHLQDFMSAELEKLVGEDGKERWRGGHWLRDPRVQRLLRFERTPICSDCNNIDGLPFWQRHRPSPYFSFSPDELREIREQSGEHSNKGAAIRRAVLAMGKEAAPAFLIRTQEASILVGEIAREWRTTR